MSNEICPKNNHKIRLLLDLAPDLAETLAELVYRF